MVLARGLAWRVRVDAEGGGGGRVGGLAGDERLLAVSPSVWGRPTQAGRERGSWHRGFTREMLRLPLHGGDGWGTGILTTTALERDRWGALELNDELRALDGLQDSLEIVEPEESQDRDATSVGSGYAKSRVDESCALWFHRQA